MRAPTLVTQVLRVLRPLHRQPDPTAWCTVEVDGTPLRALPGQSVAAALVQANLWQFSLHPLSETPRGPYCGMGVCFECELEIDGVGETRACLVAVEPGMVIRTDRSEGVR